jgi:putative spermidine/putrescine transport system ATP-binding protein
MTISPDVLARFRGVRKTYDGVVLVVKDLDLDIVRGEFLTLLGPSGSGKTTTLMMLAGFETPTAGDISLEGRDLARLPPHKRDIGMVFQNYALFPHMSVAENVAFPLSVRGIASAEIGPRVDRALNMVRLTSFGNRRPGQLSGGQQQRVALARALVFEPKLVLMDEPLGALDKQLREEMQLEIRHLHEHLGVTIVYVTHDQAEALTLSDRVAVFHDGRIQQLDAPKVLYERPRNAFVARFIGENNRLPGSIEAIDRDRCLVRLDHGVRIAARMADATAIGQPAIVSVRPERIDLRPSGSSDERSLNRLPARLRETIYLGDHVRVRLQVGGRDDCMVKLPITRAGAMLQPDASLDLVWAPDDCLAFAPE